MENKKEHYEKKTTTSFCDSNSTKNKKQANRDNCEKIETNNNDNSQEKIEKLEEEISTLKDTLLRKLAESDNLRKRLEKEKSDAEKYASSRFAKDLLSVIDNFDRVSKSLSSVQEKINQDESLKQIFEGISLCGKELLSVFKKHGISQIEISEGTHFDPHYHQAMCELESKDHEPGTIIGVMQSGYTHHDRLLRPAMVSVAKKSE